MRGNDRKRTIRVSGEVRQALTAVARTDTQLARRAQGILSSGSRYMSEHVFVNMLRSIGA